MKAGLSVPRGLSLSDWPLGAQSQGYFLDVLGGGGQQTLAFDIDQSPEPCISMTVKLFGICKRAFDRLFSALVNPLTPLCQTIGVSPVSGVLPDMARDSFSVVGIGGTGSQHRTGAAFFRVAVIMAVSISVGCRIRQKLTFGAAISITLRVINVFAFGDVAFPKVRAAIARHAKDVTIFKAFAIAAVA
ncbi:hypothetical protein TH3_07595 [Thalassospira xiamenensis M-5 = DSM 17429]|uniref:Uncharacterized protein n=1 Tax=Thalassospira xiamenensis M-5 = DSM 17429 TaxID=1123366 RepID=A0AB72UBX2_9PROT|nr:hypothetical protein TH3_07595 [Thalassospira xiamenensis M-5 = DSM 17429]